jgi:hypothetical protein
MKSTKSIDEYLKNPEDFYFLDINIGAVQFCKDYGAQ